MIFGLLMFPSIGFMLFPPPIMLFMFPSIIELLLLIIELFCIEAPLAKIPLRFIIELFCIEAPLAKIP
jgi:hypothetical protein